MALAFQPVRSRVVLFAPGFEPMRADQHRARFTRTLARSTQLWGVKAEADALLEVSDGVACFQARAAGPNWRTEVEFRLLTWDDLLRAELARSLAQRLGRGLRALGGVIAGGTLTRYAAAHWRYALFALWPLLLLGGAVLGGVVAGLALGALAGVLTGAALATVAWRRGDLGFLLADWAFAHDLAQGAYQERIARFADEILAARRARVDEVVLVGHSLGAVFAVQAMAEALRRAPNPPPDGPRFVLIGLGSSVLKVALLSGATRLRSDLAQLAATPGLDWIDYASRRDVLSFERTEPVGYLGLTGRGPRVESVHPRDMVDAATWVRIRWNFLRQHRQYVMGNGRRYFLDFGLLTCGPLPAGKGLSADQVLGPDGALPGAPVPRAAELAA
jgi:hypothetical protein